MGVVQGWELSFDSEFEDEQENKEVEIEEVFGTDIDEGEVIEDGSDGDGRGEGTKGEGEDRNVSEHFEEYCAKKLNDYLTQK